MIYFNLFIAIFCAILSFNCNAHFADKITDADIVIVGSSAVGQGAIKTLSKSNKLQKLLWISEEPYAPYNKCNLSGYLETSDKEVLDSKTVNKKINTKFNHRVVSIDSHNKSLVINGPEGNETIRFNKLLLGVGVRNKDLPFFTITLPKI